jgi:hypothetical protein
VIKIGTGIEHHLLAQASTDRVIPQAQHPLISAFDDELILAYFRHRGPRWYHAYQPRPVADRTCI